MCDNPVAAVALVGLHGHAGQRRAGPVVPGGQDGGLRAMLSVLRRPQTAVDRRALRRSHELQTPLDDALGGRVDPASARLATITPWHAPVLVAVVNPVTRRGGGHPRSLAQPGLLVFTGEGSGCCATGASVAATGAANYENDGGPPAVARVDVVVPDGVGRVVFHVAAGKGEPTHAIASTVHGNVAAVQTRGSCCAGWSPLMTWYTADGRVLKRVVRFNGGGSVVPPASPTPVRITVRPSAGASRTTFAASFRAPRAGEDYSYKLTGPPGCSAVTGSFATRRELGVRGRRIAIPLSPAPGGRWCAGVWTVSVGLGTHNRSRTISPAGPTFGSARFTVRR